MKTYILDTIDRFKRYSQTLDVQTILCQKAWYVLNEDGDDEKLIFQKDGTIIVSINGTTKTYQWEYIPSMQSVHIKYSQSEGIMLKPAFLDGIILAFQKTGTNECMFLIDDSTEKTVKINTLSSVKNYLLQVEQEKIRKELAQKEAEQKQKEEAERREIEECKKKIKETQEKLADVKHSLKTAQEEMEWLSPIRDILLNLKTDSNCIRTKRKSKRLLSLLRIFDNGLFAFLFFLLGNCAVIFGTVLIFELTIGHEDPLFDLCSIPCFLVIAGTTWLMYNIDRLIRNVLNRFYLSTQNLIKNRFGLEITLTKNVFDKDLNFNEAYFNEIEDNINHYTQCRIELENSLVQLNDRLQKKLIYQ